MGTGVEEVAEAAVATTKQGSVGDGPAPTPVVPWYCRRGGLELELVDREVRGACVNVGSGSMSGVVWRSNKRS